MAGTKKILLVEDDNNLREIYGARLQAEGYEIVSAPDGENALAIAVKEKPDLIISDIMMPKVSGFDMLDILRNAPETKDTKIIMMTALSQAEDKARADKLGADMYLVKSQVTLEDVAKAVHQILDDPSESAQEAESAAAQEMVSGSQKPAEEQTQAKPEEQPKTDEKPETPKEPPAEQPALPPAQPEPEVKPEPKPEPEPQKNNEPVSAPVAAPEQPAPPAENPVPVEEPKIEEQPKIADSSTTSESAPSSTSIPVSTEGEDTATSQAVEPSLAQALEDEEKAVQEKIENFEKTEDKTPTDTPATPSSNEQTSESNPQTKNEQPASQPSIEPKSPLDEKPGKKVIEPINDPTKGPDINELIAKEEAKEAAENNVSGQTNQVVKPSDDNDAQTPQDSQNSSDSKEDFGKISL